MAEAGRPSLLTDDLLLKIRESILAGNNLKETANLCGIEIDTIYDWNYRNYRDLSTLIDTWVSKRRLDKAEKRIEDLIHSQDEKVALNASTFIAETIGRKTYSKRTETDLTSNGQSLGVIILPTLNGKPESTLGSTTEAGNSLS